MEPESNQQSGQLLHEKLEAILENAVDAIITIDDRGIIESANYPTEQMFGYRLAEIVGQNVSMLMPAPWRDEHDGYIQQYLQSGVGKIIGVGREVLGQRKDGSTFPVHLAVSEIRLQDRVLFTGIVRDISDLKVAERKLESLNRELKHRVQQRTADLKKIEEAQARLVQNERLAAIGQMVAGLAHESRNSLQRSHACLANLAIDVKEMPESLELVRKTQDALDNLNSLLNEVRNYAAPIVLEKSPTDLEAVAQATWTEIVDANPTAGQIDFQCSRSDEFPETLYIDRHRFGQVFWNLLENARFACDKTDRPGRILIRMRPSPRSDNLAIEVSDSGPGIEADSVNGIFEPFVTTKTKGTGLGLAICRRIIEAHDGTINVSTPPASGAVFTISLKR